MNKTPPPIDAIHNIFRMMIDNEEWHVDWRDEENLEDWQIAHYKDMDLLNQWFMEMGLESA